MANDRFNARINRLFAEADWRQARELLEKELANAPDDHWLLTQLGVTFYEERRYPQALKLFRASKKIVPDCPLTLWHLAGALDALGKHGEAKRIYTAILESKKSPEEDPCWESKEWAAALKADCLYRLGACFENLSKKKNAERCYREYLNVLLLGAKGMYSAEEVTGRIRALRGAGKEGSITAQVRRAVTAALTDHK